MDSTFDIAIFGSGPAGSVLAMTLCRQGFRVLLIERQQHPRFAIGESTTPLGNLILETLGHRYNLPELVSISEYGKWQRDLPHLSCGLKRGFSFFYHQEGKPFSTDTCHVHELLVAASADDATADTHWLRSEVDQYLMERAVVAGATYWDLTRLQSAERTKSTWKLTLQRNGTPETIACQFIVDASGPGGTIQRLLQAHPQEPHAAKPFLTRSRSLYNHFDNMPRWEAILNQAGISTTNHPFPCDQAALHHVFDGGWMWVLRLDNGVVSAGFSLCPDKFPLAAFPTAESEWEAILARFPGIAKQFAGSRTLRPWVRTGAMQYRSADVVGEGFAQLPHAAYFLDPLFSHGMAHTFLAIERLTLLLGKYRDDWQGRSFQAELQQYAVRMQSEMDHIDQLIAGCHASMKDFSAFVAHSMLYFSGAILHEEARRKAASSSDPINAAGDSPLNFLFSQSPLLQQAADANWQSIHAWEDSLPSTLQARAKTLIDQCQVKPLRSPQRPHMYP